MSEQYISNLASGTLSSAFTAGGTSLILTSASGWPTSGTFSVNLANVIYTVTGVSGNTLTITSTPETGSSVNAYPGAVIYQCLSARALAQIQADTLATTSGVTAGEYGSSTLIPQITVNAAGRVTSASTVSAAGGAPSGSAGGDLTGSTYPNPTVATVGGATASNIASATAETLAATNADTVSTIVKRDGSGNFSAGTITASLTGNCSGTAATFTGDLTGNVTSVGMSTTIAAGAVTNSMIAAGTIDLTAKVTGLLPASHIETNALIKSFGATFNGGGTAMTAGVIVYTTVAFGGTIISWDVVVDTGTVSFDIWKIASGSAIPTVTNTIVASAPPAIATGTAIHSTTLTGWTTSVTANDIIGIKLAASSSATYANLIVTVEAS